MAEFSSLNGYAVKDNVARSIAKGRNQAVAFVDYATMIETLNEFEKDEYKAGQNVYIGVVGVPDLWVYSVEDIRHTFIYESDEDVVEKLTTNTTIQVGFFKLAMLEGQKVDLTTYDQKLAEHDDEIGKNTTDISALNESLVASDNTPFRFGVNENGKYGYIVTDSEGADAVIPFSQGIDKIVFRVTPAASSHEDHTRVFYYADLYKDGEKIETVNIMNNHVKGTVSAANIKTWTLPE